MTWPNATDWDELLSPTGILALLIDRGRIPDMQPALPIARLRGLLPFDHIELRHADVGASDELAKRDAGRGCKTTGRA
ncbi:hypothetical protein ACFWY6_16900 [Streptomyces sp. NPDC059037]|uniref:hypothetical protein n=1 Tax=Streptomyces sp. NPDC059037 TaxID=3346710 RepID=UPI0036A67BF5